MSAVDARARLVLTAVDLKSHVDEKQGLNAQNHPDLLPYTVFWTGGAEGGAGGGKLHIEKEWWEQDLLEETRKKIREAAANHELDVVVEDVLPVGGVKERNIRQPFVDLYRAVFEQYEYEQWATCLESALPPIRTIEIPKRIQRELARLAKIKVITGRSLNRNDLEDIEDDPWMTTLSTELAAVGEHVFVKMPTTSSKNEQKMRPVVSARDCLDYITNTNAFAAELEWAGTASLVVLPWLFNLDRRHEYRVFVHRRHVTAISQQQWYKRHFQVDAEKLVKEDAAALIACFETQVQGLMPYGSGVLDMWVERGEGGGVRGAHLIEINPWGAGFSSGSSLFHWRRDYDTLYGNLQAGGDTEGAGLTVEVRYVGTEWGGGSTTELIELMDDLHIKDQARVSGP